MTRDRRRPYMLADAPAPAAPRPVSFDLVVLVWCAAFFFALAWFSLPTPAPVPTPAPAYAPAPAVPSCDALTSPNWRECITPGPRALAYAAPRAPALH